MQPNGNTSTSFSMERSSPKISCSKICTVCVPLPLLPQTIQSSDTLVREPSLPESSGLSAVQYNLQMFRSMTNGHFARYSATRSKIFMLGTSHGSFSVIVNHSEWYEEINRVAALLEYPSAVRLSPASFVSMALYGCEKCITYLCGNLDKLTSFSNLNPEFYVCAVLSDILWPQKKA